MVYDKLMTMNDDLVHHNDCDHSHDLVVDDRTVDDHIRMVVADGIYPTEKKTKNQIEMTCQAELLFKNVTYISY